LNPYAYTPLVEVTRGPLVESVHYGAIAVVDSQGRLLANVGDPQTPVFLRSTSKPIQVLPFVEAGGVEHFGLTPRELAVMCASHEGTDEHVRVIRSAQAKAGVTEDMLQCGVHPIRHKETARAMRERGEGPTPIRHNCSGKHTGFLAYCLLRGEPLETYLDPEHPIQQTILQAVAEMSDIPARRIAIGIDGCSAPVFALPLYNAALSFARLADPAGLPEKRAAACRKVTAAMTSNPDMVAGPEQFDTLIMELGKGKIVAKGGAEAYQGMALLPDALYAGSPGIGITMKIADGDGSGRARTVAAVEVLRQMGLLGEDDLAALKNLAARPVCNWRGISIGELRPAFQLQGSLTWSIQ